MRIEHHPKSKTYTIHEVSPVEMSVLTFRMQGFIKTQDYEASRVMAAMSDLFEDAAELNFTLYVEEIERSVEKPGE
jgi:hypothetical protein